MDRWNSFLSVAGICLGSITLQALDVRELSSPSGAGAMGSSLVTSSDGAVYLSWIEPAGDSGSVLKFARYEAPAARWSAPHTIAQGRDWFINWADFPVLAVQRERMTAAWFVNSAGGAHGHHAESYHAVYSTSDDDGTSWSTPQPVATGSNAVEFVALQPLADGRLLAAWLDGRHRTGANDRQALFARVLAGGTPDQIVDPSVCDCCQLSFAPTADGGALLAYRGRTNEEVRDMRLARFDGKDWNKPVSLGADGWKIRACPVNGPRLAGNGNRIAATWYTAAQDEPRVLAAISNSAGNNFGSPARLDLGRPQGRVDTLVLADGTAVVTWLEMTGRDSSHKEGGIYLRTLGPTGTPGEPHLLASTTTARASGFPRLALIGPQQAILSYTLDGEPSHVRTLIITFD